ncbi:uncharacterized protein LOC115443618 isoform X1 [Manduca sexta]|uniref:uncharacterized protein LOC115443618 isoform X1 n=1 Tax=Manduca sexta TaxID=7130 RepID=UPI00188FBC6D|nr:uncharacterized protein LOC115443618 isoform X1 [Manduca sexta]
MAKRNVYPGFYNHHTGKSFQNSHTKNSKWLTNMIIRCFWAVHAIMYQNYLAIATIFAVVALSFIIPDISKRIHATTELGDMKKVLDLMSTEVRLAEVACLTDVNDICNLHSTMQDDGTETSKVFCDLSLQTNEKARSTRSEPVQVENKVGFFRRILFPVRNTSRKEITIMSYVYTDSFDDQRKVKNNTKISEL